MSKTTDALPFQPEPTVLDGQEVITVQPATGQGFNPTTHGDNLTLVTVAHVMLADGREVYACRFCWRHFNTAKQVTAHMGSHGRRKRRVTVWSTNPESTDESESKVDDSGPVNSDVPCPQCGQSYCVTPFTAGREALCESCNSELDVNAVSSLASSVSDVIAELTRLRDEALVIGSVLRDYVNAVNHALTALDRLSANRRGVDVTSAQLDELRAKAKKFDQINRHLTA